MGDNLGTPHGHAVLYRNRDMTNFTMNLPYGGSHNVLLSVCTQLLHDVSKDRSPR